MRKRLFLKQDTINKQLEKNGWSVLSIYPTLKEHNNLFNKYKRLLVMVNFLFVITAIITGCSSNTKGTSTIYINDAASSPEVATNYDAQAQGVIKEINTKEQTITFQEIPYGKEYTLNYNGATEIYDKYEGALSIAQIKIGEIADLYSVNETNKLVKLQISNDAWEYKGVNDLVIDKTNKIMSIKDHKYQYSDDLIIANKDKLMNLIDINEKDELILKGKAGKIYSVIINKGHGYIRLVNYDDFIGGMVEVGYDIIVPIIKDMIIVSREGNYKVTLENGELVGSKMINVIRDQEVIVDMQDFKLEPVKKSSVQFNITPIGATLYVDNKLTDYEEDVELAYGKHTILVKLSGYTTYSGIINVDSSSMNLSIDLVEENKTDTDSSSTTTNTSGSNTTGTNTAGTNNSNIGSSTNTNEVTIPVETPDTSDLNTNTSSNTDTNNYEVDANHKMYIQKPEGATAYMDGEKIGTVPINIEKRIGTHTITFSKAGAATRSYTIEVLDDSEDVYYTFPDMISSN